MGGVKELCVEETNNVCVYIDIYISMYIYTRICVVISRQSVTGA